MQETVVQSFVRHVNSNEHLPDVCHVACKLINILDCYLRLLTQYSTRGIISKPIANCKPIIRLNILNYIFDESVLSP